MSCLLLLSYRQAVWRSAAPVSKNHRSFRSDRILLIRGAANNRKSGCYKLFAKGSPKCGPGKYIGMKPMVSAKKSSRSNGSPRTKTRFVLCVRNTGYPASLETRKLYSTVPDAPAARHNLIRVFDESGGDYLYPADYFVALRLPANVKSALLQAS